ncbi:hypothetical protein K6X13_12405 [Xanthomonas euvesicatoria pv. allii]|uniref:hypothetical protein n=1 Tax=Xanthomonas euvesicatoria TaxID=456327 RepID=UPI0024051AE0|nr:hypothetical protein [Xanthomonas euvesicatoria]MCP3047887.1 hypothetical protein [Xanthomonas euvesicatoria pv. allii]
MKFDRTKFRQVVKSTAAKVGTGFAAVAAAPFAFAQTAGGIGTTVSTLVDTYKEEALIAIMAMIVVLWTLKATGVLKPR